MSTEENKRIERRFMEEVWNRQNLAVVDELFTPDIVLHGLPLPAAGRAGIRQWFEIFLAAFPDSHMTVEDLIADGDRVVTRWTYAGTHRGEYQGLPATGKRLRVTGVHIDRFIDGKIAERWVELDQLGMLQQLGVIPPPGEG